MEYLKNTFKVAPEKQKLLDILLTPDVVAVFKELKSQKKRITFDMDGVEVGSSYTVVPIFNEVYQPREVKNRWDLTEYFIIKKWIEEATGTDNADKQAIKLWNSDRNLLNAPIEPGSEVLSWFLYYIGFDTRRITSRDSKTTNTTYAWYQKMPWIDPARLHIQPETGSSFYDYGFKTRTVGQFSDIHYDDNPFELREMALLYPQILFNVVPQPWNSGEDFSSLSNVVSVDDEEYFWAPPIWRVTYKMVERFV